MQKNLLQELQLKNRDEYEPKFVEKILHARATRAEDN